MSVNISTLSKVYLGVLPDVSAENEPDASPETLERLRQALGGAENIISVEPGAKTRLLVKLRDKSLMKPQSAESGGFIICSPEKGEAVHVLVGLYPERYYALT